jgi:hypothetical protein
MTPPRPDVPKTTDFGKASADTATGGLLSDAVVTAAAGGVVEAEEVASRVGGLGL